ncbi:DUF4194 domain-containing protein [Pseudomonas aeruginosa]|uniref:DUF4194 domain-containing protein n=1 Tax=Pseudomonas aeruginosa TaxID=287 RepID=UPI0015C78C95|nr:DUF4194 domain-containing protein [Pseudomonas aeruginosa]MBH3998285.1 DUF4194 domain-containing protein [Pseudomonas aeruginosa]MBH4142797.1 DUF4194 domain-containing protein [Pseudomonas aeruginosa]MDG9824678.1 DUF4194 domain-containing protein [Pseudomonas aeruginosa]MDG9934083.1 DUF4194 domain-containing protein [Pseudomonas aeruginosa]MDH0529950.1 DUF4194 domain-containing protein [Pseudomonas aeruginosa]
MAGIFDRIAGASGADETELTAEPMALDDGMDGEQPAMSANIQVDERRTPQRVREAVQEMLKYGMLEESHKPNLYRSALTNIEVVDRILEPLDLAMGVDEVRGLVFVTVRQGEVAEQDDWSHPLVRRQRLNLEQSLLIAILRQHFIAYEQESGTGASQALVAVDELIPQLQVYLGELGSEAKERNRIITLLDQLKGHGLVSALDAHDRVIIRPIITHLANPENLQALVVWLREQVEGAVTPAAGGEEDEA